jgi:hypothetical protein
MSSKDQDRFVANLSQLVPSIQEALGEKSRPAGPPQARRALVVFTPGPRPWWLAGLKRGFGHCFVVLDLGDRWILLESLAHLLECRALPANSVAALAGYYADQGFVVLAVPIATPARRLAPIMPLTCVEVVKRAIGLHSRRILTPFQLFRYLKKNLEKRTKDLDIGTDRDYVG